MVFRLFGISGLAMSSLFCFGLMAGAAGEPVGSAGRSSEHSSGSASAKSFGQGSPEADRTAKLTALTAAYNAKEKVAFAKLSTAAVGFREARVENEIDTRNAAHLALAATERTALEQDFYDSVITFEQKKAPKFSVAEVRKENVRMNQMFVKLMKTTDTLPWGSITKNGIIKAQKAWVVYRNAWIEFAKIRASGVPTDSIDAWVTKKRNQMFDSFLHTTAGA